MKFHEVRRFSREILPVFNRQWYHRRPSILPILGESLQYGRALYTLYRSLLNQLGRKPPQAGRDDTDLLPLGWLPTTSFRSHMICLILLFERKCVHIYTWNEKTDRFALSYCLRFVFSASRVVPTLLSTHHGRSASSLFNWALGLSCCFGCLVVHRRCTWRSCWLRHAPPGPAKRNMHPGAIRFKHHQHQLHV